ncbi:MAG TPA: HEAT repeat domain-containing protein [Pirellulales bacterium]|nr:HEAT repeat domain-containing protein [Pirellulales bacterium]
MELINLASSDMDVVAQRTFASRWIAALALLACSHAAATAQHVAQPRSHHGTGEAEWIWSPTVARDRTPTGQCYFRKTFEVANPEQGTIAIACDDRFELVVNGRHIGHGNDWRVLQSFDITKYLRPGPNVVAVKAENVQGSSAGLVARLTVKSRGATYVSHSTDRTWKTRTSETPGWDRLAFNDSQWQPARSMGELGSTAPWGDQVQANDGSQGKRFSVTRDFRVERVVPPEATGSVIGMAFNEWGEIVFSKEGSGLQLIIDKDKDGSPETVVPYCDRVVNSQGILPLNGEVFAVGDGPQGAALYRISDDDHDSKPENVRALFGFENGIGEHGVHALALGPEGMIYVMIGNHSSLALPTSASAKPKPDDAGKDKSTAEAPRKPYAATSPYHDWYEGDLLEPKYEDANGHAVGIKAPCGTIVRTDADGTTVELFAGGLRNAYDMAFDRHGELWTYDSDMEWDMGLPWYRPTRIYHVTAGAEFGSRSGWSPWPEYFLDNLPAALETGRGSPTGVEIYNHHMYPVTYQGAMFLGDWSQGRILVVRSKPAGGTYEVSGEVFLEGRPLNVTDMAVGPDGWLYFCTGGRGTEGGIYRVVWTGKVPPQPKLSPVLQALRQPQLSSAWGRQKVAVIQEKMGPEWKRQLPAVALEASNEADDRVRALDMMQLYGPAPDAKLLARLARDHQPIVRAKIAYLIGTQSDAALNPVLVQMLGDQDPLVRRRACEAMVRGKYQIDAAAVTALLADPYRFVAWSARRALQSLPSDQWQTNVVSSDNIREFLEGSAAALTMHADRTVCLAAIERGRAYLRGYISDDDFVDLMRVFELALIRGKLEGNDVARLRSELVREYPTTESRMNRELIRLLAYLQEPSAVPLVMAELKGKAPDVEKLHAALCARFLTTGWTGAQKLELLQYYEQARKFSGGQSYAGYIENVSKDFFARFNDSERQQVLAQGHRWPTAALTVLSTIDKPSQAIVEQLIELDGRLRSNDGDESKKLQMGIIAVLAASGRPQAMAYLRDCFERYPDRREDLAMGLAQSPSGENWPYLIRSLSVVEGVAAQEVLMQLAAAPEKSNDPAAIRQVILCGLKLKNDGGNHAATVLKKWTSQPISADGDAWDVALSKWQKWYASKYPAQPAIEALAEPQGSQWSYQELLSFLSSAEAQHGQAGRGVKVFEKAQCIKCHRHSGRGEAIGPDLSTVGQRFQRKEILESIVFPSQVVSDQYASKIVVTDDGLTYTGMIGSGGEGKIVVLQSNGEKVSIPKEKIEQLEPSRKSVMPEGLLNGLTLEEVADLFAYLTAQPSRLTQRPTGSTRP